MSIRWLEHGDSEVTIDQGGNWVARLFGLPFLGVGSYLLAQFLDGLWRRDLTVAGFLLLPVITAAFLVPGWILAFGRKRTTLDADRREATEVLDFIVYKRRKVSAIPPDASVLVRYELRRTGRSEHGGQRTHLYCPVEVTTEAGGRVLVAVFDGRDATEAAAFAGKVATFLGLPVQDLRQSPGEVIEEVGSEDAGEDASEKE
jgi:hypothetical protein